MPYPNEHACRLREPDEFQPDSFRRVTRDSDGKQYSVVMGRLKGESTMTEQTYRYNKDTWNEAAARAHCKAHKGKLFEPAGTEEEQTSSRWIPVAKKDQVKKLDNGDEIILTEEALISSVDSWKNGDIIINHKETIPHIHIKNAKYEKPFLYMLFDNDTEKLFRNTDATGWSVQFEPDSLQFNGNKIIDGKGVGISVLYPPHVPACTPAMGCHESYYYSADECTFEMNTNKEEAFEGKVISAKNESELKNIAEDVKKGFERLFALLKNMTSSISISKEEKKEKEADNQKKVIKKENMEQIEELTSQLDKAKADFETLKQNHDSEVKELKDRIAVFEQERADAAKAAMDAKWEQLKKEVIPPGIIAKEEETLKAEFEQQPHNFIMRMAAFKQHEETKEEGSEYETTPDELAQIAKEMDEAAQMEVPHGY